MTFMNLSGLGDAKEPEIIPECRTHLRVTQVFPYKKEETGRDIIRLAHRVEDDRFDNPAGIFHYLNMPLESDTENTKQLMLLGVRRYLEMAGIPFEGNGFNVEDLNGAFFEADVAQEEREGIGMVNVIKVPALTSE
ncbi:MAG: hypothetical protein NWE76_01165 [Candidatus Bathyarchaeota archaeon]|nr:hypothetical protein [Candidatus Bathyarchaeota archaeon]